MGRAVFLRRENGRVEIFGAYDTGMIDDLKFALPRHARGWDPENKCWWVLEDYEDRAHEIAERRYGAVVVAVTVDEMDRKVAEAGRQSAPRSRAPSEDEKTLCVAADAPREVVDAAYRALAKLLHPDHHGAETTGRMQAVNDAYARLKKRSDPW